MSKNDIVLHTCCAPCAGWCVQKLLEEDKRVRLYYSNDNLCSLQMIFFTSLLKNKKKSVILFLG